MTDEFPHDPDLADALRSHSGGDVALGDARAAVLGRATTIRRRRLAAVTSAAVLVVGGVALTAGVGRGDPGDEPIALELPGTSTTGVDGSDDSPGATSTTVAGVAGPTTTSDDLDGTDDSTSSSTTTTPDGSSPGPSTSTTTTPGATGTTSVPGSGGSTTTAPRPTTTVGGSPTTTVGGSPTTSSTPSTSSSSPTSSTSPTSTTAPIAPFTKTYNSTGGSITVNWNGTTLSLVSTSPTAGYDTEIENNSQYRIRVRFRSEQDDSRIEVRINDGQLIEEIS